jgi:hypothetical protein
MRLNKRVDAGYERPVFARSHAAKAELGHASDDPTKDSHGPKQQPAHDPVDRRGRSPNADGIEHGGCCLCPPNPGGGIGIARMLASPGAFSGQKPPYLRRRYPRMLLLASAGGGAAGRGAADAHRAADNVMFAVAGAVILDGAVLRLPDPPATHQPPPKRTPAHSPAKMG